MKFSKETEAKLAKLSPGERARALELGRRLAKAKLAKMLDQLAAKEGERSTLPRSLRQNSAGDWLH